MSEFVKLEISDGIAEITLSRIAKRNALTIEMIESLINIGQSLKNEKGLRCVVIKGANKTFSAGIDIKNFASLSQNKRLLKEVLTPRPGCKSNKMQMSCTIWNELMLPVIAVLEGPCFGAGLQLALGADIRIASEDALLSIMEVKWGLIPDMGITTFLPKLLPYDQAMLLTLTSDIINAKKARELGLVTICTRNTQRELEKLLKKIVGQSPSAIRAVKQLYTKSWNGRFLESLDYEAILQSKLIGSANQIEAVFANFEKRKAKFVIEDDLDDR
ncbi:MAG: crotonase/enoyl-CoA hydratase family protein [Pseudomonadota bacterium]|nr:crotonase/enoyl-CoA hydratase family protein [Pseudomonadota bacterium]